MSATHYVHKMYLFSMQWFKRTDPGFSFGVPMILREQRDHSTDCYFCMTSVKGLRLLHIDYIGACITVLWLLHCLDATMHTVLELYLRYFKHSNFVSSSFIFWIFGISNITISLNII